MSGFVVLLTQALLYFVAMAVIFRARARIGLGVFYSVIGTMHFLETYLAAVFFIELPFGLISPGSTVMFTGKLAFLLLLYIKEDAESIRQPIYGLLFGNILMVALAMILRAYGDTVSLPGYNPDLRFLDQIGFLMIWGTALLFIDLIAMVVIYERIGASVSNTTAGRIFISLAIVLTFDQALFYVGLHLLSGVPISAFYGGWIAKIGAAAFFSLMLTSYLRFVETGAIRTGRKDAADVFDRLTYRHRYERLVERIGRDPLTGLKDRGELDARGPALLQAAGRSGRPLSLMMIDIDHFKAINDRHGHPRGDEAIRQVADTIGRTMREGDELFRYGGEEFALLCPETLPGALALAERIRMAVEAAAHPGLDRAVTISVGIAGFPAGAGGFAELLRRADAALYEAKETGRNRVVATPDPEGAAGSVAEQHLRE